MILSRSLLVFTAILFFAGQVQATTFDEYMQRLKEHPQVSSILAKSDSLKELSASEMGLPDPKLILGVDNLPVNNPRFDQFLPSSKVFGFNQQIPGYGLRKAKSNAKASMSARQKLMAGYTLKRLEAIFIGQLAVYEKVNKQIDYAGQQLKHYKALEDYFKGQLESGGSVYWRFSEIDVERSIVEQKLNDLRAEKDGVEAKLISLVGEVPDVKVPSIPLINWENNPISVYAVSIAEEDLKIAEKGVEIADSAFWPNYGVNALYKKREQGASFAGDDWFSVQATVSVPIWASWNQKPKLRAAKAKKHSAVMSYDDTRRIWVSQLTKLSSDRDATLANIRVFTERDKAIGEMVKAAMRNYEAGNSSLESVLDAQINQLTIKSQLARQRSRHMKLSAEFNSHIIEEK